MSRLGQWDIGCLISFVPAREKSSTSTATQAASNQQGTIDGDEVKAFYEELCNKDSSVHNENNLWQSRQRFFEKDINSEGAFQLKELHEIKKEPAIEYNENGYATESIRNLKDCKARFKSEKGIKEYQYSTSVDNNCVIQQNHNRLLFLAQNGDLHLLKKLLEGKAVVDIDYSDRYGWTALMCAVVAKHKTIVRYLLSKGADRFLRNSSSKSAFVLAKEIGATEIFKILECFNESLQKARTSTQNKRTEFYCEVCKSQFTESTEKEHSTSTVHLLGLNLKPKPDPFVIPSSNVGYQLMRSSGWDGETGLGPERKGNRFPVKTVLKNDRLCLGTEKSHQKKSKITHFGPNDLKAVNIEHKHSSRILSAKASSRRERRRKELKDKRWERNLRQYWDMDTNDLVHYKF